MSSALLVIDVQESFRHRPFWTGEGEGEFRARLLALDAGCRAAGVPVVHVLHEAPGTGGPFDPASGHVRTLPWVPPSPAATFRKRVHSALVESGLREWLDAAGVRHLVIAGIRTEQCCETTARHASDLGYRVTFVTEATLTFAMTGAGGRVHSAREIREHTALVLEGRFARIATVEEALELVDPARRGQER